MQTSEGGHICSFNGLFPFCKTGNVWLFEAFTLEAKRQRVPIILPLWALIFFLKYVLETSPSLASKQTRKGPFISSLPFIEHLLDTSLFSVLGI